MPTMITIEGSCHCRKVRFEIDVEENVTIQECNCSICRMSGYLHLIVAGSRFRLLSGEEYLTTYTFNTGTAKHLFCKVCGIKAFYVPRSNPDGYSINLRCIDKSRLKDIRIEKFDGQNWEQSGHKLKKLSEF